MGTFKLTMNRTAWYLIMVLLLVVAMFGFIRNSHAVEDARNMFPVYQARTLNALTLYSVGGSTTSAATYGVYSSTSLETVTAGGKYPGRHIWVLADYTYDTLISSINSMGSTIPGCEGGLVAALVQGSYGGNPATLLANITATSIKGVALVKTLTGTDTYGITYIFPAIDLGSDEQYHITGGLVNATFTTGTVHVWVYNGTATTDTVRDREKLSVSGIDGHMQIPSNGELVSSANTALRFDVACSTNISAGWLCIQGFKE